MIRMLDWKRKLDTCSSNELFDLFRDTNRINIEPQLYAGNLLFERGFDLNKLIKVKLSLKESLQHAFDKKYHTNPRKIIRENVVSEITLRIILFVITAGMLVIAGKVINIELFGISIAQMYWIAFFQFLPLIRINKSNEKAIRISKEAEEKKDRLILQIEKELKF
ncbi:hypothetical protein [Carboxylicivirga caseinilyticus]|uniref:hypothetical protein n=1 Tax=Carboxylicivirga caseinilyticus TaxID=3417572 RepID=UPI003D3572FE|nr:hypothetical protein [Marinilabiliaceae bacterium A049]